MPARLYSLSFQISPSSNHPSFFYHGLDAASPPVPERHFAAVCVFISICPASAPVPGGHYHE